MNRGITFRLICAFAALAALATGMDAAEPRKEKDDASFLRVVRDGRDRPQALESAIVRYLPRDDAKSELAVDLVAAIHIADRDYYETLNQEFRNYDAVLFELVAEPDAIADKNVGDGSHPVSIVQNMLRAGVDLEHQLTCIDYKRPNFVHADMSPDDFQASLKKGGESWSGMAFRLFGAGLAQEMKRRAAGKSPDVQLLFALADDNRPLALKRVFAEQMALEMDVTAKALDGPNGSTLLSKRNQKALEVLRREIAGGKRKLAIFYGAAHMGDMERRLQEDFQLRRGATRWVAAWNLRDKPPGGPKQDGGPKRAGGRKRAGDSKLD